MDQPPGIHLVLVVLVGPLVFTGCRLHREVGDEGVSEQGPTLVSAGSDYSCAAWADGRVQCWGASNNGKGSPPSVQLRDLAAGGSHTCAVTDQQQLRCWGLGTDPEATEETSDFSTSRDFDQAAPPSGDFAQVSAGRHHTCAVSKANRLECWGMGSDPEQAEDQDVKGYIDFDQANPPGGADYRQVAAGKSHSCAATTSGDVECWGQDDWGQADPPEFSAEVVDVAAGFSHSCAVTAQNEVRCWGRGSDPDSIEGGDDFDYDQAVPPSGDFVDVTAGGWLTCALSPEGSAECWGFDDFDRGGELEPPSVEFEVVDAGSFHACGITTDDEIRCWGRNLDGQASPP